MNPKRLGRDDDDPVIAQMLKGIGNGTRPNELEVVTGYTKGFEFDWIVHNNGVYCFVHNGRIIRAINRNGPYRQTRDRIEIVGMNGDVDEARTNRWSVLVAFNPGHGAIVSCLGDPDAQVEQPPLLNGLLAVASTCPLPTELRVLRWDLSSDAPVTLSLPCLYPSPL